MLLQLLHMIKKDLLLARKYVLVTAVAILAMPLLIIWMMPVVQSAFIFLYMVIIGEMLLLQVISQEEGRNPKAVALLCVAPYSRNVFVKAKYVLPLLIFAYCYIAFTLVVMIINPMYMLTLHEVLIVLLISAIIFGIYIPIEIKYGFIKARYLFMIIILLTALGPNIFISLFSGLNVDVSIVEAILNIARSTVLVAAVVIILGISLTVSTKIYAKKEL